jgi:hypothetical protein
VKGGSIRALRRTIRTTDRETTALGQRAAQVARGLLDSFLCLTRRQDLALGREGDDETQGKG